MLNIINCDSFHNALSTLILKAAFRCQSKNRILRWTLHYIACYGVLLINMNVYVRRLSNFLILNFAYICMLLVPSHLIEDLSEKKMSKLQFRKRKQFELVSILKFNNLCIHYIIKRHLMFSSNIDYKLSTTSKITVLDKCLIQNFEIIRTCIPLDISISWIYVWLPHK